MNNQDFYDKIFKYAKERGFTGSEIYFTNAKTLEVMSFGQKIENFSSAKTIGIGFRGLYIDRIGYSYTEIIDEDSIKMLVDNALENVLSIDSQDKEALHDGSGNYIEFDAYKGEIENISIEDKLQIALDIEKKLMNKDKIIQTNYCIYGESVYESSIINTNGINKHTKNDVAYIVCMAIAGDKTNPEIKPKTGVGQKIIKTKSDIDIDYIIDEAHQMAVSMLGAQSIPSGEYCVVFKNKVVNDLMRTFSMIFSAENVQKGLSLLKGKLNKQIATPLLTIYDDPFMKNSVTSSSFDDEGVATYKKELIKDGVLKTYLHNIKTAKKDNVNSTGNARRGGHRSTVEIAPTNMVIKAGENTPDELLNKCDKGLYISKIEGMHSGCNPVSLDFSLSGSGFLIENGKMGKPVDQITISGNLLTLFNNIDAIGNDIKISMPSSSTYHSPSILVKGISVGGL